MASGRPRQPNDPSVMASLEAAMSTVARPRLIARMWPWRYEFGLIAGVLLGTIGIGVTLGPGWLIAAAAVMAVMAAALTWPPSRQRITARAWCVITPTGCGPAARGLLGQRRPRGGERLPQPHRGARGDPASPARFTRRRHVRLALPGPRRRERRRARGACLVQRTGIKSGGG